MSLVDFAEKELKLAGLFDADSDYDGMIGPAALDIVKVFAEQGHSGYSAALVTSIVEKLMRWQPLTPITSDPDEWMDLSGHEMPMWQNRRDCAAFSRDGGKTWYHLDDEAKNNGDTWRRDATGETE